MTKTAVIVDDSRSMRQMVAFTLCEAGFDVIEGADGQQALDQIDEVETDGEPVQVIITDLNMPVMDGMDFIRKVRSRSRHKYTPILMLTTEADENKMAEGRAAGATGWLIKPFDPDRLLRAVSRVLP